MTMSMEKAAEVIATAMSVEKALRVIATAMSTGKATGAIIIPTLTGRAVPVAVMTMNTIIMRMKFLQAGVRRLLPAIQRKRLPMRSKPWRMRIRMVSFCAPKACCRTVPGTGPILIMCRVRRISGMAELS